MICSLCFRSAVTIGGTPFHFKKCSAVGSAGTGAAAGAAVGGVPGAIIGGIAGLGSSLLGGLFGRSSQKSANKANLQIMREQNKFNAEEAEKQRNWTQLMQQLYGTASAKANDMRAAGLNSLLNGVQASQIGSGAQATAAESAKMEPLDYSDIGQGVQSAVDNFNNMRSLDSQVSLQKSQENLNKATEGLQKTEAALNVTKNDSMRLSLQLAKETYQYHVAQEWWNSQFSKWSATDTEMSSRLKIYDLYNIKPQQVEQMTAQTMSFYASAFRDFADGKYSLTQMQNYGKWLSIQQTFANASSMQGRAALMNADTNRTFYKHLGSYYDSLTQGNNITNDLQGYYRDFMLGKLPIGKADYILRQTPYRHLLDLNIQQQQWTLNKLMEEPGLILNMSKYYGNESELKTKQIDSYDTDKFFDRMGKVTKSAHELVDTYVDARTKGAGKTFELKHYEVKNGDYTGNGYVEYRK